MSGLAMETYTNEELRWMMKVELREAITSIAGIPNPERYHWSADPEKRPTMRALLTEELRVIAKETVPPWEHIEYDWDDYTALELRNVIARRSGFTFSGTESDPFTKQQLRAIYRYLRDAPWRYV